MSLVQLIYVSAAIEELSDEVLDKILESSVRHNLQQGITGMLLYSKGNFMQVLEGEASAIDETYSRICRDFRHSGIIMLSNDSIEERDFSRWSMGFHRISNADAQAHPAYAPMFLDGFDAQKIGAVQGLALEMLKQFAKA